MFGFPSDRDRFISLIASTFNVSHLRSTLVVSFPNRGSLQIHSGIICGIFFVFFPAKGSLSIHRSFAAHSLTPFAFLNHWPLRTITPPGNYYFYSPTTIQDGGLLKCACIHTNSHTSVFIYQGPYCCQQPLLLIGLPLDK